MCGRYVSTRSPAELTSLFHTDPPPEELALEPSWNVAPTDDVWAVLERVDRDTGEIQRQLRAVRWGLVPSWAKSPNVGPKMINARVESVADKPAYRRPFAKRRCLLPADGFYEWQSVEVPGRAKPRKQPYFITPEDGSVMALAGLYEFWRDPEAGDDDPAAWWTTCTIITTDARDAAGRIHPRMPLAIPATDYDSWLDPAHEDPHALRDLMITPAAGHLMARPVSTAVNNVRNDGPQLIEEAHPADDQPQG